MPSLLPVPHFVRTLGTVTFNPGTYYGPVVNGPFLSDGAVGETDVRSYDRMDQAGRRDRLFINVTANATTAPSTFTSRVNHAAGAQSITIPAGATGFFISTDHDDLLEDDTYAFCLTVGEGGTLVADYAGDYFAASSGEAYLRYGARRRFNTTSSTAQSMGLCTDTAYSSTNARAMPFIAGATVKHPRGHVWENERTSTQNLRWTTNVIASVTTGQTGEFVGTSEYEQDAISTNNPNINPITTEPVSAWFGAWIFVSKVCPDNIFYLVNHTSADSGTQVTSTSVVRRFCAPAGSSLSLVTTDTRRMRIMRRVKVWGVGITHNGYGRTDPTIYTVRKNGVSTDLAVSAMGGSHSEVLTEPIIVEAGDEIDVTMDPGAGNGTISLQSVSIACEPFPDDVGRLPDRPTVVAQNLRSTLADLLASVFSTSSIQGGTVTEAGGYRYHTFTESDSLIVYEPTTVEYLVVAGGGAGGTSTSGRSGGGGAGGVLVGTTLLPFSMRVTVGAGGVGPSATNTSGPNGEDSELGHLVVATGGGGGGGSLANSGRAGGSGGGAAGSGGSSGTGGAGIPGQGHDGRNAGTSTGGGGGGAGGPGGLSDGGPGIEWPVGSGNWYGGGGGGARINSGGAGGIGGGGAGSDVLAESGQPNTGGGGGGEGAGGSSPSGSGGSGIVIIRYPI
jgi:hypothetical protein